MLKFIIIVNVYVNLDKIDLVKDELEKFIFVMCVEKGCFQYDFYQDNECFEYFLVYEVWELRELWQVYMNVLYLFVYIDVIEGVVVEFMIREMSFIG